jgi:RES domain-containing protein
VTAIGSAPATIGRRPERRWPASAPWRATAWSTGPDGTDLDVSTLATTDGNRWSGPGEPTIYLAGDPGVALAEFGRHWSPQGDETHFWCVQLELAQAVDLRDDATRVWLGLPDDVAWVLDSYTCRAVARLLRAATRYDGMIVPSAAFLDDPTRWNAVVFLERIGPSVSQAIGTRGNALRLAPIAG